MLVLHVVYFEPPVNSLTIKDLHLQYFPGPGNPGKKSRTFQDAREPCNSDDHEEFKIHIQQLHRLNTQQLDTGYGSPY